MSVQKFIIWGILFLTASGCASTPRRQAEEPKEEVTAIQSVMGAVSGQEVDEKRLRELAVEMKNNKETQSAVESVAGSLGGTVAIKYCPIDGQRFSSRLERCPEHNILLKNLE